MNHVLDLDVRRAICQRQNDLIFVEFFEESDDMTILFDFGDFDGGFVAFRAANVDDMIVSFNDERFESIQLIIGHHAEHVVVDHLTHLGTVLNL